ncbi:MAG: RagB/SusD family nutrient uptake outer membrane protein, partial [Tannerellaceae bacterium]|nr:RagB/SusD family nutrient uptake outer membrane protein [Tannerellaceae bacterium]
MTYTYGAVPLSTEEIDGMNYRIDWERNSVSEIREVMEEDLKFAVAHLPLREENNNLISGAVARHYLSELYLAMGKEQEAITALKPLVEGNEYSLMTQPFGQKPATPDCPFIDVFMYPSHRDGNKEILFYFLNAEPTVSPAGAPSDIY